MNKPNSHRNQSGHRDRSGHRPPHDLRRIADGIMREKGLMPDFPKDALDQAQALEEVRPPAVPDPDREDLSSLLWSSIDNDDSRDLDQIEVVRPEGENLRLLVAIADVDYLVKRDSAIDRAAYFNTTSVYTGVKTYPMLPERLSFDLTSLLEGGPRPAMVVEILFSPGGEVLNTRIHPGWVQNHAKLTYHKVAAWLDGQGDPPEQIAASPELEDQLRRQDALARVLHQARVASGALVFDSGEARVEVGEDGKVTRIVAREQNRAEGIIEELMIAANQAVAAYLAAQNCPGIRRVVKVPEHWERIVELARDYGVSLPAQPDSLALSGFLLAAKKARPDHFQDLSLAVIKLIGRGEYHVLLAGKIPEGHFGLALRDYLHSTAPNRRYPDVATQRILKAACAGAPAPYLPEDLEVVARHCTEQENNANKVERQVRKCAAAELLDNRIGEVFEAMVTGSSPKGIWVRIYEPPVEGKLLNGGAGLKVGDKLTVRLVNTDPERGFIDFEQMGSRGR